MDQKIGRAEQILKDYKKDSYSFGIGSLPAWKNYCLEFGPNFLLLISGSQWASKLKQQILSRAGKELNCLIIIDSPPIDNPINYVLDLAATIDTYKPESILAVGGGSAIDSAKAANVAASLNASSIEPFLGIGKVTAELKKQKKSLFPLVAVQTIAGSGSHLSQNSVITFPQSGLKKIITDISLVPDRSVFDYGLTASMDRDLTLDGALDGLSHCLEVYFGSRQDARIEEICLNSISIIVQYLPMLLNELNNIKYREAMGIATDLGGYALMLGGTSGAHLNSFSMVDLTSHGRACAILNPYYTVFYSPAIQNQLEKLAPIFKPYMPKITGTDPRSLGEAVAQAMLNFYRYIGFPVKLTQLKGYDSGLIDKILNDAKNPQLAMKLKSMPVALDPENVDQFMYPILKAAESGQLNLVKNMD